MTSTTHPRHLWRSRLLIHVLSFAFLMGAKWFYATWQSEQMYLRWEANGLFAYNSLDAFWEQEERKRQAGLIPYGILAAVVLTTGNSVAAGIAAGVLLVAADVGVDLHYAGAKDGQVGIAILIVYTAAFLAILIGYLGVTYGIARRRRTRDGPDDL